MKSCAISAHIFLFLSFFSKVWDVSELGNPNDPNFKLRYAPRIQPIDDGDMKSKEQAKEIEKLGGVQLDNNQNQQQPQDTKIMIGDEE